MNHNTVTKCLIIQTSSFIVKSLTFYDIEADHRHKFHSTIQTINEAYSRKNSYRKNVDSDAEEWWAFIPRYSVYPVLLSTCLHARSCSKCGGYISTKNNCTRIQCNCL